MKENYEGVNPARDTTQRWCISCKMSSTMKQATVQFADGKHYKYISRFPIKEGDIAIIGNSYPAEICGYSIPMETSGMMGLVTEIAPKIEIKKRHAAELDFVFSMSPDKRAINHCAAYLENDDYAKVLQFSKDISPIRPITHFIRRLLAASSILANKELASAAAIESAEQCIQNKPKIDVDQVENLNWGPPETIGVDFEQVFFSTDYSDIKGLLPKQFQSDDVVTEIDEAIDRKCFHEVLSSTKLGECVAKYSYLGAISIMARGGFTSMLKAFMDAKPPIEQYAEEVNSCCACNETAIEI